MSHEIFTSFPAQTITVPITLITMILSIISVYDSAILARSGGDYEKAQHLYKNTARYVLLPISSIALAISSTLYATEKSLGIFFVIAVMILFFGLSMSVYCFAYVTRPNFKMVPLADRLFEILFGWLFGADMAVIAGRGLLTVMPFVTIILTCLKFYGPNPS